MLKKALAIFFACISFFSYSVYANTVIHDYRQTFFPCYNKLNELRIAIRMYSVGNKNYLLLVDPYTFNTEAAPAENYTSHDSMPNTSGYVKLEDLQKTPYLQALSKYTVSYFRTYNNGIKHAEYPVDGVFLTVDMCPSHKPFENTFFQKLVALSHKTHHPTPVALSITGLWMLGHPQEFNWLIQQEKLHTLDITWINHSFSHVYYIDVPISENFLMTPHTNMAHEILATEKLLLEHDQLPSVFFRFPGLASNKERMATVREYGLIPIGTNAWLAKDEKAKQGSIVLVHGNSNEHRGIEMVMPLLQDNHLNLLPLSEAFSEEQ